MPDGGRGLSREQVLKQIDESLGRLGARLRRPLPVPLLGRRRAGRGDARRADRGRGGGKARFIGVSNWSGEQIRGAVELAREQGFAKIVSSQPEYSLLHREPEEEVIPASRENGVSQIVYSPLAQGVLSGKYPPGRGVGRRDTRGRRAP